jgi:low affinity Fe/Cu permease
VIRVSAAQNSFVGIEHLTDEELAEIREQCESRAKVDEAQKVADASVRKTGRKAKRAAERSVAD